MTTNAKRALFIDRDGTLIVEPVSDQQVDSLEKLEFIPGVFRNLHRIKTTLDFEFVMVTNQDGLGTPSFPEETFWPSHEKMLRAFENEGVVFDDILIDRSFPHEQLPTRKPGTGLLGKYLDGTYDLKNSYVIGDRETDVQLARNLGAKAIFFSNDSHPGAVLSTTDWNEIARFLSLEERSVTVERKTNETDIVVRLLLDGSGKTDVQTGLGFFDHMLDQLGKHSGSDLYVRTAGDLHIDEHHTVEDTALAIGEAFRLGLGDKRGIERYGYSLPMDDARADVAIDFSGRPWLVWDATFERERVGDVPTELFYHFFKSFSDAARCNLHVAVRGDNEHHKIEAAFKGLARAIRMAVRRDPEHLVLPSTKGAL